MNRADVANLCMALWRFERVRLGWENLYPKNVAMLFKFLPLTNGPFLINIS